MESRGRKRKVGGAERRSDSSIAECADLILKWALIAVGLEQR